MNIAVPTSWFCLVCGRTRRTASQGERSLTDGRPLLTPIDKPCAACTQWVNEETPMLQVRSLPNARSARVVSVVEVTTYEGDGTPESIGREVVRYYTTDGELLAERDPATNTKSQFTLDTSQTFLGTVTVPGRAV